MTKILSKVCTLLCMFALIRVHSLKESEDLDVQWSLTGTKHTSYFICRYLISCLFPCAGDRIPVMDDSREEWWRVLDLFPHITHRDVKVMFSILSARQKLWNCTSKSATFKLCVYSVWLAKQPGLGYRLSINNKSIDNRRTKSGKQRKPGQWELLVHRDIIITNRVSGQDHKWIIQSEPTLAFPTLWSINGE